jgi:hypothetical protein
LIRLAEKGIPARRGCRDLIRKYFITIKISKVVGQWLSKALLLKKTLRVNQSLASGKDFR